MKRIARNFSILLIIFSAGTFAYGYSHETTRAYIAETNGCEAEIYPYIRPGIEENMTGLMTTEITNCPNRETFEEVKHHQNTVTANSYTNMPIYYSMLFLSGLYILIKLE